MDQNPDEHTIDLDRTALAAVGATRGEREVEIGPPSDQPDHAELTVRRGDDGIVCSVDVTAGDLGTGHADVTLTDGEARSLRVALEELLD
ncbi:hypothetical protein [Halorubrum sp. DTA98]|uniref:hypothetical protein n=1 Tax=Halorubrum sp. DTA98 TaxID=3402163 RepID=UPI003AB0D194